jgi:hypothetical protein
VLEFAIATVDGVAAASASTGAGSLTFVNAVLGQLSASVPISARSGYIVNGPARLVGDLYQTVGGTRVFLAAWNSNSS